MVSSCVGGGDAHTSHDTGPMSETLFQFPRAVQTLESMALFHVNKAYWKYLLGKGKGNPASSGVMDWDSYLQWKRKSENMKPQECEAKSRAWSACKAFDKVTDFLAKTMP